MSIPAHLIIGQPEHTRVWAITHIQEQQCAAGGCRTCPTCTAIAHMHHHALLWFEPETSYTRELLEPLFARITFAQDPEQNFFFVFNHANRLNDACTNALLKSIEEPPAGYYFIFLAQELEAIAPTIRSRCHLIYLDTVRTAQMTHAALFAHFTNEQKDPSLFLTALDKGALTEYDTRIFINALFEHFSKQALTGAYPAQCFVTHIQKLISQPPMPGSSKIYLRDLYLHWYELTSTHMPTR